MLRESGSVPEKYQIQYTTVTGFFFQDEPDTDPIHFDYVRA